MKINYKVKIGSAILAFIVLLSYGLKDIIPFVNSICVFLAFSIIGFLYYFELRPFLSSEKTDAQSKKDQEIEELSSIMFEMEEVIKEYETMLSEQVVKLPCSCGKSLFEGILIPNVENMCECPSCKETYKVLVSYDSILITDPLDSATIYDNLNKIESSSINNTLE